MKTSQAFLFLFVTIAAFSFAFAPAARAAVTLTVSATASSGSGASGKVFDSSGGNLSTGNAFRVGTFDTSGANLATLMSSNDFLTVDALFKPLGEGNDPYGTGARNSLTVANGGTTSGFGQPNFPNPGSDGLVVNALGGAGNVFGSINDYVGATAPATTGYFPEGTQIYWWVFNVADPEMTTPTEWGIFTNTSTGAWTSPDPNDPNGALNPLIMNPNQVVQVGDILRGSDDGVNLRLAVVPEPAQGILMLIGTGLALGRRKQGFKVAQS